MVLPPRDFTPPPIKNIREVFTAETEPVNKDGKQVNHTAVKVFKNMNGEKELIYSYTRNYGMYKTFEPFQQLGADGIWHNYALISPEYVRFEVLNLDTGEVVAVEPYPKRTQEDYDWFASRGYSVDWEVGDEIPSAGFCPVEFRVFDWWDRFNEESLTKTFIRNGVEEYLYSDERLNQYTGQWGLLAGCHWGDDGWWKLRYIDLSRISEGEVAGEERFGYLQLTGSLNDVRYDPGEDELYVNTPIVLNRKTGEAEPLNLKWAEED